ncbi:restriction endonuclease subunit S [Peptoniphilus grossensis]|uniref:Restriction endonuclease subunit S n=1 Tax=Peptoniphilus grossensis TaxID=1465756 RepID=A0ABU7X9A0_9FIRM
MSKIDELLKNEKVEWKKLGEVCEIKRGRVISKTYLEQNSGDFPVYSSQTRNNGEIGRINTYDFDGEYATWTTDGAYAGTVFYRNGKFSITNICGLIKPNDSKRLLVKYIVYWLQIEANKHVKGGSGNPKLMSNVVANIKIPIPSLETQEKIVKILDKFTNYVIELQTELQTRNKQYEYYRDMLLSEKYLNNKSMELFIKCNNSIKKCKLKNVAEITRGKRLVRSDLEEIGKFPVFQNSLKPLGYYYDKNFSGDKTCVISAGAAGEIFYRESDFWAADDVFVINSDLILNKYIYYFLLSKQRLIKSRVRKASIPRLSREEIERLEILIPSVELQKMIVEVLDKFQDLLSDTQGLLPEEIEQRQKQYEYYREKLLTFDENMLEREREDIFLTLI